MTVWKENVRLGGSPRRLQSSEAGARGLISQHTHTRAHHVSINDMFSVKTKQKLGGKWHCLTFLQVSYVFANVCASEEDSWILLSTPAFSLLKYVVFLEENPASRRRVSGKRRTVLIPFPDICGLALVLFPQTIKGSFHHGKSQYGIWGHYQENFLILLN